MPQSRELANKKNDHKDRQSRGPMGSAAGPKKGRRWCTQLGRLDRRGGRHRGCGPQRSQLRQLRRELDRRGEYSNGS
ncbi:hypothetical protein PC116_g21825 [Phytophthora cactorum]|uniref:Uncharacterized protein n=1 Tax=Phytophthora cactorum TaxID=29920 RepID=A0A8T1B6L3_9STRA|nr:hypothetical protein PC112_g18159 [Phytophthora cactorum]KAG2807187.1 hypothetical protein PC111_g17032 [Phytophthora cactorum]KAG2866226.1 hypothetical protein PC113_g2986 [Phytophthora cactorum]KAG2896095.1 hypothetical protein PC115_g17606 [Phytophthora cactorum]KAG2910622.1 hypothetical protein PC117_g19364 [Phytophthora cactorum]